MIKPSDEFGNDMSMLNKEKAFSLKYGSDIALLNDAMQVRMPVFVQEQGVPPEVEADDYDAVSMHVVVYNTQGQAVATGRLLPDGHIGRMAVIAAYRGQGLGAMVLTHLLQQAQQRGQRYLQLSAQCHAQGFYEHFGFVVQGDPYLEVGIPHVNMVLTLPELAQS